MVDQEFKELFMCQTLNISLKYDAPVQMTISSIIDQYEKVLGFLNTTYNNRAFIYTHVIYSKGIHVHVYHKIIMS